MSRWVLVSVTFGPRMSFGCLGGAVAAEHAAIAPLRGEDECIRSAADLARITRDVILLKPIPGILWKDINKVILRARKWALRWIERRGGRVERFSLAVAASSHGETSRTDGLRIILPAEEIPKSMAKLRRVSRILAQAARGGAQ